MDVSEEERNRQEAAIASVETETNGSMVENDSDLEDVKQEDVSHGQLASGDGGHNESGFGSMSGPSVKVVKVVPLPHARSEVWSYFGFIADDDGEIQDKKKAICKICATTLSYSGNTTNLFTHLKAMHPEANPQKLAPTNRTPRTGKKSGKRKFNEILSSLGNAITLSVEGQGGTGAYIMRAVNVPYSGHNSSTDAGQFLADDVNTSNNANGTPTRQSINSSSPVARSRANEDGIQQYSSESPPPQNVVSTDDITDSIVNMLVKDCRPLEVVQSRGFQELMKLVAPGYKVPDNKTMEILLKKRFKVYKNELVIRGLEENDND